VVLDLKSILGKHFVPTMLCAPLFTLGWVPGSFAYVDFGTPDAKLAAIALSERNLEGRRLLIKDGSLPPSCLFRG
jgi:hypothetical protein